MAPPPPAAGPPATSPDRAAAGAAVRGLAVRVVGHGPLAADLAEGLAELGADLAGPDGPLDALVFAPWDPEAITPIPVATMGDDDFDRAWQQTMDAAVAACVEARERFGPDGGRIVLCLPTTAMSGGANYAHWAAAAEGVRLLAKSAARQWGPEGIAVNAVAVSPEGVLADPALAGPVSIAAPARPDADPLTVVALLCSPVAANLAGQTLTVDGGLWI